MTRAWRGYLLAGIPLTIVYLWLPVETAKLVLWPVIGLVVGDRDPDRRQGEPSAEPARLVPARCRRGHPADGRQPLQRSRLIQHSETLFPSYVDVVYLAMYPLLIAGLALLVHRRSGGRDRAGVIDAAIITAAWDWSRGSCSSLRTSGSKASPWLERLASIAYPVGDVALWPSPSGWRSVAVAVPSRSGCWPGASCRCSPRTRCTAI